MSEDKQKVTNAEAEAAEAEAEATEATEADAPEAAQEEAQAEGTAENAEQAGAAEEQTEEKADDGNERYMRLMAEFQNYKKRVAKEKTDIHAYANEKIIVELLEVMDNFERALQSDAAADTDGYVKGMGLIFDQMKNVLTKAGLEEVDALGQEFDPACHNAVMTEDTEEFESNQVSKVLQKGYSLNKKVIRPAMVTVAK